MEQLDTQLKQVDVLPMVKHFMDGFTEEPVAASLFNDDRLART